MGFAIGRSKKMKQIQWEKDELKEIYQKKLLLEGNEKTLYYVYSGAIGGEEFLLLVTNNLNAAKNCAKEYREMEEEAKEYNKYSPRNTDNDYIDIRHYSCNFIDKKDYNYFGEKMDYDLIEY